MLSYLAPVVWLACGWLRSSLVIASASIMTSATPVASAPRYSTAEL